MKQVKPIILMITAVLMLNRCSISEPDYGTESTSPSGTTDTLVLPQPPVCSKTDALSPETAEQLYSETTDQTAF